MAEIQLVEVNARAFQQGSTLPTLGTVETAMRSEVEDDLTLVDQLPYVPVGAQEESYTLGRQRTVTTSLPTHAAQGKSASRADLPLSMRHFDDDEGEPGWRMWLDEHPRRAIGGVVCAACCCCGLLLLIVLLVLLMPLRGASTVEGRTRLELLDVCDGGNLPFITRAEMANPASVGVTVRDFEMFLAEGGTVIASASMSGFDMDANTAGEGVEPQSIELTGTMVVENEDKLVEVMNRFFLEEPLVIDVTADVTVVWAGLPISTTLEIPVYLNDTNQPKPDPPRTILQSVQMSETEQALNLMVQLLFNHTSEMVSIHMPEVSVDVYYNDVRIADGTVAPNFLVPKWNPWSVQANVHADNVSTSAQALGKYLNEETLNMVIRGAEKASDTCFLQKVLKRMTIAVPVEPDTGGESSVALRTVFLSALTDRDIQFSASVGTRTNFTILGNVPAFALDVERRESATDMTPPNDPFASIEVSSFYFLEDGKTSSDMNVAVAISDDKAAFDAGFGVFDDKYVALRISGARTPAAGVLSRLLNALKFDLEFNRDLVDGQTPGTTDLAEVRIERLLLLDADATSINAELEVAFPTLLDFQVTAKVPGIYVELHHAGQPAVRLGFDLDVALPEFGASIQAQVVDAKRTADMLSAITNGDLEQLVIRGRPQYQNVLGKMLQHLDTVIDLGSVTGDVEAGGDGTAAFAFDAIDVARFEQDSVGVSFRVRLSDSLRVETQVPLPDAVMGVKRIGGGELVRASFSITIVNNVVIVDATVRVSDMPGTGKLLSDLVQASKGDPTIGVVVSGVTGTGNVIGTVLSFMSFEVTIFDGESTAGVEGAMMVAKESITITEVAMVSGANQRAHFSVPLVLVDNVVNVDIPPVQLEVKLNGQPQVMVVGLERAVFRRGETNAEIRFSVRVPSQDKLDEQLNKAFGGTLPVVEVVGAQPSAAEKTDNLVQRVLAAFKMSFEVPEEDKPSAETVKGGVMPAVELKVLSSTPDLLTLDVGLKVQVPEALTFPVDMGDMALTISTEGTEILLIRHPNLVIKGGENDMHFNVQLTAVNDRKKMEAAISAYTLGLGLKASLGGSFSGARFDVPVGMAYNFAVPPKAGGDDTSFVECVDIAEIEISGFSSYLSGNCRISFQLEAFMQNPLPFDIVLHELKYTAEFDDHDGAFCLFGGCFQDPQDNVLIGQVDEKPVPPPVLKAEEIKGVSMYLDGSKAGGGWNALCARLGSAYYLNNDLAIDIEQGVATVGIENFVLAVSFEFPDYAIDSKDKRTCAERRAANKN